MDVIDDLPITKNLAFGIVCLGCIIGFVPAFLIVAVVFILLGLIASVIFLAFVLVAAVVAFVVGAIEYPIRSCFGGKKETKDEVVKDVTKLAKGDETRNPVDINTNVGK